MIISVMAYEDEWGLVRVTSIGQSHTDTWKRVASFYERIKSQEVRGGKTKVMLIVSFARALFSCESPFFVAHIVGGGVVCFAHPRCSNFSRVADRKSVV